MNTPLNWGSLEEAANKAGCLPETLAEAAEAAATKGIKFLTPAQREILRAAVPEQVRPCGDCTLCCRAPAIEEGVLMDGEDLDPKPHGETCAHCKLTEGCSKYEDRPDICHDYACLWSMGWIPEENQPEDTKVCWTMQPTGTGVIAMGHCMSCADVLADQRNLKLIPTLLSRGDLDAVTIRCMKEVYSFLPGGEVAHALTDPTDPMRMQIDPTTEKIGRYDLSEE